MPVFSLWDVIIVGGGPAGLSAALILGRANRKVLLIDHENARHLVAQKTHGYLTQDGISPEKFRQLARQDLKKYPTIHTHTDCVVTVQITDQGYQITTRSGSLFTSKKLIIATGVKDHLPPLPGLADVYGTSVFPCPYCDGWERRQEPLALFGNDAHLFSHIKLIHHWSLDLMVFTNGPALLQEEEKQALIAQNIDLVEDPIAYLQSSQGQLEAIVLENGERIRRRGGFLMGGKESQATLLPHYLGIPFDRRGAYITNKYGETPLPGLHIIGDAKNLFTGLVSAAAEGYEIGEKINEELIEEAWSP